MPPKADIRLGQLLIQKQWCTLRQVTEALDFQANQRGRGRRQNLGRVLIAQGALDEERLMRSLAELGALVLSCKQCAQDYSVSEYDPGNEYTCHNCGYRLTLGDPPKSVDTLIPYASSGSSVQPLAPELPPEPTAREDPGEGGEGASSLEESAGGSRAADPFIGKVLGGCRLLERVAAGGMGVIYKAQQLNLNRTVAVKVLSRELSNDESFVRRFLEEARSAAQLNHGNIIHINDVGDYHGIFYFTMEYVDGVTLKKLFREQKQLPVRWSLEIIRQVCAALQHAHSRGIIHRDIKPENIMITRDGVVKLADLGLAKKIAKSGADNLTQVGSILGTPFYMAPEQAKDFSQVDGRSDIYSLGVTLFKMVTGKTPFTGRTPIEVMIKVIDGKRPGLRRLREDVPPDVEAIVDRMMCRDPDKRYQTVDELIEDLDRFLGASKGTKERAGETVDRSA